MIVGWSTALRGQVINEKSRTTPEETGSRPASAGKDRIITQRIGDETGWTTARSLGEVGATSVHSKPVFVCSDCTFRPGLLNKPFHCMSQKNTPCRSGRPAQHSLPGFKRGCLKARSAGVGDALGPGYVQSLARPAGFRGGGFCTQNGVYGYQNGARYRAGAG